jgi:glycosyltransferase involved in cell wall biosynthesis
MKKNLSILFTGTVGESIPPPYGGIPKRALMLGKIWREQGHTVAFTFTYRHAKEDDLGAQGNYFFEFNKNPTKLSKIPFVIKYFLKNPKLYIALWKEHAKAYQVFNKERVVYSAYGVFINDVITECKPDVVVCEAALIRTFMAAHVAKRRGLPVVFETYAEVHYEAMVQLDTRKLNIRPDFWKPFLGLADVIVGPSHYCARGPLAYIAPEKVKVAYATTLDVKKFDHITNTEEKATLRKKFNLPENLFLVMAVGAFTSRKGHDHIIEAVADLSSKHEDIGVVLCGAGEPAAWKKLAEDRGVKDRVFIYQNLSEEDLMLLYRSADLYCDASNTPRACLGIALTEGLASRLPALAYDVGGLPEVVVHDLNGYLVPLNDSKALAQGINKIYELPREEQKKLGQAGFDRAQAVFDINSIAAQVLTIIRSAMH